MGFKYNEKVKHKAIFFGPGDGYGRQRPKTALCKMIAQSEGELPRSGIYEPIDEDICKRNWKDVTCKICLRHKPKDRGKK